MKAEILKVFPCIKIKFVFDFLVNSYNTWCMCYIYIYIYIYVYIQHHLVEYIHKNQRAKTIHVVLHFHANANTNDHDKKGKKSKV
jgi:hypothetical protein